MNNNDYVGRVDYLADGQYSTRVIYTPLDGSQSGELVTELSSDVISEGWGDAQISDDGSIITHHLSSAPEPISANGFSMTVAALKENDILNATFNGSPVEIVFHESPVAYHGPLRLGVSNSNEHATKIYNQHGETVQLCGLSFFWSGFSRAEGNLTNYWQEGVCQKLAGELNVPIVRAAISADASDSGSYYYNKEDNLEQLKLIVEEAKELGQYVIIDFHSHDADVNEKDAIDFFEKVSEACALYQHVIYEIFNEPTEKHSWTQVKTYAEKIIPIIRDNAPESLIIVGTPTYCQDIGSVIGSEITGELAHNLLYSLHYYGTCGNDLEGNFLCHDYLRDSLESWSQTLPLFISEYGHSDPLGGGETSQDPEIDEDNNKTWYTLVDELGLSGCHWSICDKNELASMFNRGTTIDQDWSSDSVLTQSGGIIKERLAGRQGYSSPSLSVTETAAKSHEEVESA